MRDFIYGDITHIITVVRVSELIFQYNIFYAITALIFGLFISNLKFIVILCSYLWSLGVILMK